MKIFVKTLILIVFVASGLSGLSGQTKNAGKRAKSSPRSLYMSNCARCHGADGKGETPKGMELGADDLTSPRFKRKSLKSLSAAIARGKDEMPAFAGKLSAAEINSLAGYVRSF